MRRCGVPVSRPALSAFNKKRPCLPSLMMSATPRHRMDGRGILMKLSARNQLKGTVVSVETGPVSAKVKIDVGGGAVITSTVTAETVADLGLKTGMRSSPSSRRPTS